MIVRLDYIVVDVDIIHLSYVDSESINGLNLYAYASNNPIGIAYSSSSVGGRIGGSKGSTLALGGVIGGGTYSWSSGLSIKLPS